jgi:hypothetical protein
MYQVNIFMTGNDVPYVYIVENTKKHVERFLQNLWNMYLIDRITWRKMS